MAFKPPTDHSNFSKGGGDSNSWSNMGESSNRPKNFIPQSQRIPSAVMHKNATRDCVITMRRNGTQTMCARLSGLRVARFK